MTLAVFIVIVISTVIFNIITRLSLRSSFNEVLQGLLRQIITYLEFLWDVILI